MLNNERGSSIVIVALAMTALITAAASAPITAFGGIRPLGVENFPYIQGVQYRLKIGSGDSLYIHFL